QQVRGAYDWIAPGYGRNGHREEADDAVADSIVNRRLHHDVKWGNVKIILAYADKNAMRFSIEARVPYFDRRLVEFAFQLPPDFKIGKATRKRVLRDAARSVLPPSITDRRDRMGFAVPDGIWMKGELWPAVREAVDRPEFLAQPCFESRRAGRLLRSFESGENRDYRAVWRLWMLATWQNGFSVSI
ncbi:MAG TPA: asparagine synthase-related protein, partial [Thermoanaerobaculia bacterium]